MLCASRAYWETSCRMDQRQSVDNLKLRDLRFQEYAVILLATIWKTLALNNFFGFLISLIVLTFATFETGLRLLKLVCRIKI